MTDWDKSLKRRADIDRLAWWAMVLGIPAGAVIGVVAVWLTGGFG